MLSIKVGSRQSPLALVQVDEIIQQIEQHQSSVTWERISYDTAGDKDLTSCLMQGVADDFFTNTLDQAVLNGDIDCAIHSAKDLPRQLHPDLAIYALTQALDETDCWVGKAAWNNLPKGCRVGTSSPLRQEQTLAEHPDAKIVTIRGNIQQRLELIDQGEVDGIIVATCALKRLGLENKITSVLPWPGFPLQGQLAVVGRADRDDLKSFFSPIDIRQQYGHVHLVGAGPGDPGLITVKAVEALKQAQCVLYDFLTDPSLLDYAPDAEHIYVGKRKGEHCLTQAALCRLILNKACSGVNVVRLKGGDPFIFGRGADELRYLRDYHVPVKVVPGISAGTGLATQIGLPLTARGLSSSVAFVSGHGEDEKTGAPKEITFPEADTMVFFMGLTKLNYIVKSLRERGWKNDAPILIISNGTREHEKIIRGTLDDIEQKVAQEQPEQPGLIIAGPTIGLYHE